jgi:hypothetical protein
MIALSLFSILLGYAGNHRLQSASALQRAHTTDSHPSDSEHATGQAAGDAEDVTMNPSGMKPGEAKPNDSQSKALLPPDSSRFREGLQLQDAAERKRLVNAVIDNLKKHYVDPEVARKTADALLAHERTAMTTRWRMAEP